VSQWFQPVPSSGCTSRVHYLFLDISWVSTTHLRWRRVIRSDRYIFLALGSWNPAGAR